MGLRHSKKSVDIQSSPKKNGSAAEPDVKVKEIAEDAEIKVEDGKTTAGETIEQAAEKTPSSPNGDATADQTQLEDKNDDAKEEADKKEEEKKEKKVKKKKSFRSFSFLRREKKAAKVENTNGDITKDEVAAAPAPAETPAEAPAAEPVKEEKKTEKTEAEEKKVEE